MSSERSTFPGLLRPEDCVSEDDETAQHGDQSDLGFFALGEEALIERPQHGVVSARRDRGHVEDAAHGGASAVNAGGCSKGSACTGEGSNANECGGSLVADLTEFGNERDAGQGRFVANAADSFEEPLSSFEIDAGANQRQHGFMSVLILCLEHVEMSDDGLAQCGIAGGAKPAGLGVDHVLELITATCQLSQFLAYRIFRQDDMVWLAAAYLV